MQLEPHGSASAGTSSFAIQAHCFVRAIEHLRKVQLHVLPERVQRLGGLDGRTLSLSRIWIYILNTPKKFVTTGYSIHLSIEYIPQREDVWAGRALGSAVASALVAVLSEEDVHPPAAPFRV